MTTVEEPTVRKIGRYEVIRKIATGGMAELFLARFVGPGGFEKRCALKRILPQLAVDQVFTRMFLTEARVTAMFDHPNLVQIFELGQDEAGQFYIAMELVNGMNVRQLIQLVRERELLIPPALAAYMAVQALDGLAYAHEFNDELGQPLNLVHRDVSPQNILVSYEGAVKLVDFGIVKGNSIAPDTQAGMLKGKVTYMSPEQASGDPIDARSDLFSIGVCMYELITGEKPFNGANELMCLKAILEQAPPPITRYAPDCPEAIERIIYRALAKQREDRYASAREFQLELQEVLKGCPTPLGRHIIADFMKSLTEAGAGRFDATRLRLASARPRDEALALGFVSAFPAASAPVPDARVPSRPSSPTPGVDGDGGLGAWAAGSGATAAADPRAFAAAPYVGPTRTTGDLPGAAGVGAPTGVGAPARAPSFAAYEAASAAAAGSDRAPGASEAVHDPDEDLGEALAAAGIRRLNPLILLIFAASALAGGLAVWLVTRDEKTVVVEVMRPAEPSPDSGAAPHGADAAPASEGASGPTRVDADAGPAGPAPSGTGGLAAKADAGAKPDAGPAGPPSGGSALAAKASTAAKADPEPKAKDSVAARSTSLGTLTLNSTPRGLTVLRENEPLGRTPVAELKLPAGTHTLRLVSRPLGINKRVTVRISKGQATVEEVVVGKGTLKVNSRPWSEVFVDGTSKGKTPLETPIYEGLHEVRLVSPDAGGERIQKVEIQPGQTEDIRVKF